ASRSPPVPASVRSSEAVSTDQDPAAGLVRAQAGAGAPEAVAARTAAALASASESESGAGSGSESESESAWELASELVWASGSASRPPERPAHRRPAPSPQSPQRG